MSLFYQLSYRPEQYGEDEDGVRAPIPQQQGILVEDAYYGQYFELVFVNVNGLIAFICKGFDLQITLFS